MSLNSAVFNIDRKATYIAVCRPWDLSAPAIFLGRKREIRCLLSATVSGKCIHHQHIVDAGSTHVSGCGSEFTTHTRSNRNRKIRVCVCIKFPIDISGCLFEFAGGGLPALYVRLLSGIGGYGCCCSPTVF